MKLLGPNGGIGAVEVMRERLGLAPKYQTSFREQFAGGGDRFRAVTIYVGASVFVPQKHSDVLGVFAEVMWCRIDGDFEPFPTIENGALRSMWNWHRREAMTYPRDRGLERGHIHSHFRNEKKEAPP